MLGGAGWRWVELQRVERVREASGRVNLALHEATRLRGLAQGAAVEDPGPWELAASAAEKARDLLEPGIEPGLRKQVEDLAAASPAASSGGRPRPPPGRPGEIGTLLDQLVDIRSAEADDRGGWSTDAAYAEAFREAGLDVAALPADEAARRMRARPPAVATALAAAVDDWAAIRRDRRNDRAGAASLASMARAADPDDWRNRLRTALDQPDAAARRTAAPRGHGRRPLRTKLGPDDEAWISSAGRLNNAAAARPGPKPSCGRAQQRYPGDVWINLDLAMRRRSWPGREEIDPLLPAARSLYAQKRPMKLAHALQG